MCLFKIQFRGGATHTLEIDAPLMNWQRWTTAPEVVALVDELLNEHTDHQIVDILNKRGLKTGTGQVFDRVTIRWMRHQYKLKTLKQRLLDRGFVTRPELKRRLGIGKDRCNTWQRLGYLQGRHCNAKGEWIFKMPEPGSLPEIGLTKESSLQQNSQPAASVGGGAV
jgi:hypothetical protein